MLKILIVIKYKILELIILQNAYHLIIYRKIVNIKNIIKVLE